MRWYSNAGPFIEQYGQRHADSFWDENELNHLGELFQFSYA